MDISSPEFYKNLLKERGLNHSDVAALYGAQMGEHNRHRAIVKFGSLSRKWEHDWPRVKLDSLLLLFKALGVDFDINI